MALTVGSRLGHYDVTALIGEGGMGQVYQAADTKVSRLTVIRAFGLWHQTALEARSSLISWPLRLPSPRRTRREIRP